MDVLRWLQEVGWVFYERTANSATAAGEVAVLLWLIEQGCRIDALQLCCTATRCGHVGIRALLEERGLLPAPQQLSTVLQAVLRLAGADDQSAAVQWLLQRGAERPAAYHRCRLAQVGLYPGEVQGTIVLASAVCIALPIQLVASSEHSQ
eukprot:16258-Heterococcus_DN1.PRE.2